MCTHASQLPINLAATQDGSHSPPRKRPKLSDPFSDEDWILLELEALKSRVYRLERQLGISNAVGLDLVSSVPGLQNLLQMMGGRICEVDGFLVSPDLILWMKRTTKKGDFPCLADNCRACFTSDKRLHEHIRESEGTGHWLLRRYINEKSCPYFTYCEYNGETGDHLSQHEHCAHGERYESHIEKLAPFGIYSGKCDALNIDVQLITKC